MSSVILSIFDFFVKTKEQRVAGAKKTAGI